MGDKEFDSVLSGIIIVLLMIVVWRWHKNRYSCGRSSMSLTCGCQPGRCRCRGMMQRSVARNMNKQGEEQEGMTNAQEIAYVTGTGPASGLAADFLDDYSDATKKMSLEADVGTSHMRYCNQLNISGMPTGASSCTELEETGRSEGTASFVGLTQRKWCKSRNLATPAPDARVTPSKDIHEYCDIGMDELVG